MVESAILGEKFMEKDKNIQPAVLSVDQAHQYCGIGKAFFYRLMGEGTVKSFHLGKRRLILRDDLDAFLQSLQERENPPQRGHRPSQRSVDGRIAK